MLSVNDGGGGQIGTILSLTPLTPRPLTFHLLPFSARLLKSGYFVTAALCLNPSAFRGKLLEPPIWNCFFAGCVVEQRSNRVEKSECMYGLGSPQELRKASPPLYRRRSFKPNIHFATLFTRSTRFVSWFNSLNFASSCFAALVLPPHRATQR